VKRKSPFTTQVEAWWTGRLILIGMKAGVSTPQEQEVGNKLSNGMALVGSTLTPSETYTQGVQTQMIRQVIT
jgi:hypothetical protein